MTIRHTIQQPNFDSVIEPARPDRAARLTIRLKVALIPLDPSVPWIAGSAGTPPSHIATAASPVKYGLVRDYLNRRSVPCRSFTAAEWNGFGIAFKQAVERGWNNQLILLPEEPEDGSGGLNDQDYRYFMGSPMVQAHAEGALDIAVMPANVPGHAQIEVVHLVTPGDDFRVWMHRITNESVQFHRHYDSDWPEWSTLQITAAHEAGHWLKALSETHFEHIDAAYAKTLPTAAQRATKQYGRSLGREAALMGKGSVVTEHEARPWLTRIRRHTPMTLGWSMIHRIEFDKIKYRIGERQKQLSGRSK
jgi:hypothetical protein